MAVRDLVPLKFDIAAGDAVIVFARSIRERRWRSGRVPARAAFL